jgi:hypothetical protein
LAVEGELDGLNHDQVLCGVWKNRVQQNTNDSWDDRIGSEVTAYALL